MRKSLYLLVMVLMVVTSFMRASDHAVESQDTDEIPPQVIDIWPLPGVELSPDEAITVTFDQAMDQGSVEAAFNISPAQNIVLEWLDERTANFTPEDEWQRNTEYAVMLENTAQAENGLSLEDAVMFDIKTVGPLEVAAVAPDADTEGITADARLIVTFNRPVVPLVSTEELEDLPEPISIEPEVEGVGEWLNTAIYVFTPTEALKGATTYTITVAGGLTSVDGAELSEDYSWSFKTLPPQILSISPSDSESDVLLERQVTVTFSQPMDKDTTEAAFALMHNGEPVVGDIEWDETNTQLTFTADENLEIESVYIINIADSATSASGEATIAQGYSQTFNTIPFPGVQSTSPSNNERGVSPGYGATIYFKSPMNTETLEGKITIDPEPESWDPVIWNDEALNLSFASEPTTLYTITLAAGAEDLYGNAIERDYTFRFTTRDIETWAYPNINSWQSPLLQTGAHRLDTRLSMIVSGQPDVDFRVYSVNPDELPNVVRQIVQRGGYRYNGDNELPYWATSDNLIREWTQSFDSDGVEGAAKEVLLASEDGGTLSNGLYWIYIDPPNNDDVYQFPLGVVTANLTVKRTHDETMVWVTDMPSGDTVQETTVTIYHNNEPIARGQTDADGIFRAPVNISEDDRFVSIVAEGAGAYGVWYAYNEPELPTEQNYLYTDRPIYRPEETVYFRGVLRDRVDMDYSVPNKRSVKVVMYGADGTAIYDENVPVTDFGTYSGEILLSEDVPIGYTYIEVDGQYSLEFQIAEFRVPEFEVNVTAQQAEIFQGDEFNALTEASYYFGGGVSNAELRWYAYGYPTSFNYTGPGRYSFYDDTWDYFYSHYIGDGNATTDSSGRYLITSDNTRPPISQPMRIDVEATITDESFQAISGRTSIIAHPADIYVGLRSDRYFGRENQPMNIDLIAVTADSVPIADKSVDLTFVEIRWNRTPIEGQFGRYTWTQEEIDVETVEVRTAADGTASYEFTPPAAGIYRVRASAMDDLERTNSSTLRFWVTGTRPVWWGQPSQNIDLIADQESYKPGDTAQILIPIPFEGKSTVLVSAERAGIISYEVIEVEGSTLLYELPITEDFVPTIHFSVTLIKGIDEESLNPDYRTGNIALMVEPIEERLNVTVSPSSERAQPGETVTLDIEITDHDGNPVEAEIGLILTDKAILALASANSGSLEDTYYGYQGNYVNTSYSIVALLDRITDETIGTEQQEERDDADENTGRAQPGTVEEGEFAADGIATSAPTAGGGGGGGGGGPTEVTVREDFEQTPLWAAHVTTDADGHASIDVELPDNLTTWSLDARALTIQTDVGQTNAEVVATLPLLVRPATPRFLVVGDRVQLASVINNNSEEEQTVEAILQAEGVELESPESQTVTIPAGSRVRVEWIAVAQDVPYVDLTFIAIGADGYQDASKPSLATGPDGTIPVYRYTAPDHVGTGGMLREGGARTEGISLPPRFDDSQGELVIHADPSLAVTTIDSFDYLKNYPHQCIEQTVSRFLPNVMTYRALDDLNLADPELEAELFTVLSESLDRLTREQNVDGGWGWFTGMQSNPLVTAYATLGLIESRDAGFDIDAEMIARAENYLESQFIRPSINVSHWELNRQAFYFYVLSRDDKGILREFDELYENRLNMSYMGRAYLLMAYHELFPEHDNIDDLVSDLNTAAIISATGAHWEEEITDWWNWTSDTRTTAVVLNALIRVDPQNELLPNAVRWLMVARQGDHWQTTQETAWAVMALTDWMVLTGELEGEYSYNISLNRNGLAEDDVTPETVRDGKVLRIAISDLLTDEVNRLVFAREDGQGALYYTAHMNLRLPASEVDAISRGITVTRQYFAQDDAEAPITEAAIGDVITVRLTITLPEDVYYFVLEDPIPAGTEGVDTSLLTTSQQGKNPTIRPSLDYNPFWYWGWWLFDRTEMRDEQVNLYADFLPRGTYVYTYQIRASVPGEFQTMPAQGYAFYFPEVFGRTDGTMFTILPENNTAEEETSE